MISSTLPPTAPVCPVYTWCPDGKLVPNCSAPWFFPWQHIVHSLPPTTQKLEFNHLRLNHLINIYYSRHPGLPSALSKMSTLGKVHRLFLWFHAVILLHILSLLKSSFLHHGPEKNKERKEEKRLSRRWLCKFLISSLSPAGANFILAYYNSHIFSASSFPFHYSYYFFFLYLYLL